MEHFKTPVSMSNEGRVSDVTGRILLEMQTWDFDLVGAEILDALNAHDALLAERDELQAQRDALVGACNGLLKYIDLAGGEGMLSEEEWRGIEAAKIAALALVRGEDGDG
jgi:hypothetical protein